MIRILTFVYIVTFLGMASPAILLVLLVRILPPSAYGQLAAVQGVALFLSVFADLGLTYSGAAALAKSRRDPEALGAVVSSGLALRALAAAVASGIALPALTANPTLSGHVLLPYLGAVLTLAYALSPAWVLWGLDRQRTLALAEHTPRVLLLILTSGFLIIGTKLKPENVLMLQIVGLVGVYITLWIYVLPNFRLRVPKMQCLLALGRDSLLLFSYRFLAAGFTYLNPYVLGLACSAEVVGIFAAVEKVVRAGLQLFEPLLRYYLPKLGTGGVRLERQLLTRLAVLAAGFWLVLQLIAGPLLAIVLGPRYINGASDIGRVFFLLSLLLFLHPLSKALLLSGVFARSQTSRALVLEALALSTFIVAVTMLLYTGNMRPDTLAATLVGVEALLLILSATARGNT